MLVKGKTLSGRKNVSEYITANISEVSSCYEDEGIIYLNGVPCVLDSLQFVENENGTQNSASRYELKIRRKKRSEKDLKELAKKYATMNWDNIPDYILDVIAYYLVDCLNSFDKAVRKSK